MEINENEMRGLLAGKCLPCDMRVGEQLPAYLVRKFNELQQKLDAMAAENGALKDLQPTQQMITAAHRELEEYDNIQIDDDAVVFTWQAMRGQQKTPATDAYMNSVRAEGVDMFQEWLRNSADIFDKNGRHLWADKNRVAADKAKEFADSLRSGTHDAADKEG